LCPGGRKDGAQSKDDDRDHSGKHSILLSQTTAGEKESSRATSRRQEGPTTLNDEFSNRKKQEVAASGSPGNHDAGGFGRHYL